MSGQETELHPLRTVLAALVGGALGAFLIGYGTGQLVSLVGTGGSGAWAALGAAILGAAAGAFIGAAAALALVFRDDPARARWTTVLVTLLGGPLLLLAVAAVATRVDQDWNVPPLWLAVAVPAAALLGRWLAMRGR